MGAGSGTSCARGRALPPSALPLALAAMLFVAMHAAARAGQVQDRVDQAVNVRAGSGVDTPRVLPLAPGETILSKDCVPDGSAAFLTSAPNQRRGYVFPPLLRPQAGGLPTANPVAGTEFTLTPSLRLQETTDDNVMFQGISDQEFRLSPLLEGRLRTELTTLTLRAAADVLRYARYGEFDRMNRELALGLSHTPAENLRLELRSRVRSDHTFESALEESGVVAIKNPHYMYTVLPTVAYQLDERHEIRLGGEATANRYSHQPTNDMQARSGTLALARALGAGGSTLLVRGIHTVASYSKGDQDTTALAMGVDWKLSETLSCLLAAGPSRSRDTFGQETTNHLSLAGEGRLRLDLERFSAELGGDVSAIPGSGGEDTQRRQITARMVLRLSEKADLILNGAWYRSVTRGYIRFRDNTVFNLAPSLDFALGDHSTLRLGFDYTCIDDHVEEVYRQRQRIHLSLHLEFPRMLR